MPRVTRTRIVSASPEDVWELISDPYNLPRWWPRASRVEGVEGEGEDAQWTTVLNTAEGRGVRADFRCSAFVPGSSYRWEQQLSGTPFERHLRAAGVGIELVAADDGAAIELTVSQSLRGLSRLGGPLMRRAQREIAEAALDGIEGALTGSGGSP